MDQYSQIGFPLGQLKIIRLKIFHHIQIYQQVHGELQNQILQQVRASILDEVAESCKQDPIEFRIELLNRVLDKPIGSNLNYEPKRFVDVLKLVRDKSGWDDKTNKSMGVSSYFCHNTYVAEVIDMELVEDKPKIKNIWCAVDCGIIINKDSAKNMIEGSIIDGIGHAMFSKLNFKDGAVTNNNFDKYNLIRHNQSPSNIKVIL